MKRRDFRVVRGDEKYTFTLGAIVESLQGVGVPTDEAIALARQLEKGLRNRGEKNIALGELVDQLSTFLEKEFGHDLAQRFVQQTPPFVPIMVALDGEQTPFSKRTLAKSLQKLDFSFKDAHTAASRVEQTLRTDGFEEVSERELRQQVALSLEAVLGRSARSRYEAKTEQPTELIVLEPDGARFPYSRGILAQSLMAVGLGPELSHQLAKRTENALWRRGEREVQREVVRRTVKLLLLQEAGEEFARRYELLRSVRRPDKPIVVLIGGAPGVGKSSLASELSYRLGISRIVSSDSVRQALRSLISPELSPSLHASSFSAWRAELLPSELKNAKPKRKRVVRGFQRQVQQLTTALLAILDRNIDEATSLVLEGIHLVPGFMPLSELRGVTVIELVLNVTDPEKHRSHFGLRELQTRQRRSSVVYLEHFGEIRILQDFMVARAEEEGVSVVETSDFDQAVEQAIELVLSAVLAERTEPLVDEVEVLERDLFSSGVQ